MAFTVTTGRKVTRKQLRKDKRKQKKLRRDEYYRERRKPGQFVLNPETSSLASKEGVTINKEEAKSKLKHEPVSTQPKHEVLSAEQIRKKDKQEQKKIERQMAKQRKKQFLDANKEEDRIIKHLEKQLGLNKRKTKTLPLSFAREGLDYLLEVCDSDQMKNAVSAETELNDNEGLEEDFALMVGNTSKDSEENLEDKDDSSEEDESDKEMNADHDDDDFSEHLSDNGSDSNIEENPASDDSDGDMEENVRTSNEKKNSKLIKASPLLTDEIKGKLSNKRKTESPNISNKKKKSINYDDVQDNQDGVGSASSENENDLEETPIIKGAIKVNSDGSWEDIYGRLRAADGSVITNERSSKYIPPAVREKHGESENSKDNAKTIRLKKQLKGLLNRLAESNMHNIATQIEELYMKNSRNDMNDTLTNLVMESVVSEVITPDRLLIEHVVLITILHANVGTEVGAHFLQHVVKKFDEHLLSNHEVENKLLDNIVRVIAQLYNFKVFDAKLLYEVVRKLANRFEEKDIECILHILKSVGFSLRKDDPLALKALILDLQKRSADIPNAETDNSRVKFMLDILLAIKNNNVTKIPNYDVSYSEHLKKISKGHIRKGNYVTQLNIMLEDLLKADEKGRWWVVGSAWTGNDPVNKESEKMENKGGEYSLKLLELAKKQRMSTDVRKNLFCIVMSAEDYLDAFEKILKLGLKNQQEREIVNVILHCCLREKNYNPYYSYLTQKFCDCDRKYQMMIKYSIWDKLKTLSVHSGLQISHMAKLLIHLFVEKGLPISILKVVQFSELDKITLRFMRQILIGILLHPDEESCISVFANVSLSDKLKLFKESLRLFIHHFLLRNLKTEGIAEEQKNMLEDRAKIVERILSAKDRKM